jgi:hypothetical protein
MPATLNGRGGGCLTAAQAPVLMHCGGVAHEQQRRVLDHNRSVRAHKGGHAVADYTPYQRKIIDRYYKNFDSIKLQQLADWATDLYLAEGKKRERIWNQVAASLRKLEFPEGRIAHLLEKRDPTVLVGILKELEARA